MTKIKHATGKGGVIVPEEFRKRMQTEHGDWFGFRIRVLGNFFTQAPYASIYKKFGVVEDEHTVLANLNDWGNMTANIICTLSGRPKNSISRAVIKLTRDGMIETKVDDEDRRRTILNITPAGREFLGKLTSTFRRQEERMFGCLTDDKLKALDGILLDLLRNWSHEIGVEEGS